MKNYIKTTLLLLITLSFVSCSSEDSNLNEDKKSVLPKKIIQSYSYDNQPIETVFTYEGNKLITEIKDDKWKNVYSYTGDFITKIECFKFNELYLTTTYTYKENKLATRVYNNIEPNYGFKLTTNYTHNPDGSVIAKNQGATSGKTYILKDGNLLENGYDSFEYDKNNSPFVNIKGIEVLLIDEKNPSSIRLFKNNQIKSFITIQNPPFIYSSRSITLNTDGYPTEVRTNHFNGTSLEKDTEITKYFY